MKKVLVVLLLLVSFSMFQAAYALPGLKIGVAGNLATPNGDWKDFAGTGYGATAYAMFTLMPVLNLTAHVGYLKFGGKDFEESGNKIESNISAIPILADLRYYIIPIGTKVYLAGQVGFHSFTAKTKSTVSIFGETQTQEDSQTNTEFSFAPTVGVEFGPLDVSAFYMLISDANYLGLRVGFSFL